MTDPSPNKRQGDHVQHQIEELILSAVEPKDKAFLLIMNKIAISLDTNTQLTQNLSNDFKAHTKAFDTHETAEAELINQSRGGIKVALALIGIIQLLLGFVITNQLSEVKDIRQELTTVISKVIVHQEQLRVLQPPSHTSTHP